MRTILDGYGLRGVRRGTVLLRPIERASYKTPAGRVVRSKFRRIDTIKPEALKIAIQDRNNDLVWEWCTAAVQSAIVMHQLRVHGHKIKAEYNTHVHTFTCHKCKGTYRAKHCRVGFARRLMEQCTLSQVVPSVDDPTKAVAAPCIQPSDERPEASLICLNLKRKSGWNDCVPKGFSKLLLPFLKQYFAHTMKHLSTNASQNIMEFLYGENAFCYADQYQCETSLLLAAVLGCNTNVAALGSKAQAICAMYYLAGYLSKNPIKPHHWVSCIEAARKSASSSTSIAKDSGTKLRNAVFLLQKVLNKLNALGEVSDTQAAMLLLNEPSYVSSHKFRFVFVHPAMEFQMTRNTDSEIMDSEIMDSECAQKWSHPSNTDSVDTTPSQEDAPAQMKGKWMYVDHEGKFVTLDQHEHYLHRCRDWDSVIPGVGKPTLEWWFENSRGVVDKTWKRVECDRGLEHLNFNEYVRHVTVVKMPEGGLDGLYSNNTRYYPFNEKHPLCESHVQRLAPISFVTTVSGKRPNPPRKKMPSKPEALCKWQRQANYYGVFMGTLLSPWDRDGDCGIHNWADYQVFMNNLKSRNQIKAREMWTQHIYRSRTTDDEDVCAPVENFPNPSVEHTIDYAESLTNNLRVPEAIKVLAHSWRYATADKFTKEAVARAIQHAKSHGRDNTTAEENAVAIARLIDKVESGDKTVGLRPETQAHLDQLSKQLQELFPQTSRVTSHDANLRKGLDANWYTDPNFTSSEWADKIMQELKEREAPPVEDEPDITYRNDNGTIDFSDLRSGNPASAVKEDHHALSADQLNIFDHAADKLQKNEQILLFVHGPPGTGKTLLANRIMKAAKRLGVTSKFAACTGAAANINGGCTVHYLANLGVRLPKLNEPISVDVIQAMHDRGGKYGVLIIDEVSMLYPKLVSCLNKRWTEADILDIVKSHEKQNVPQPKKLLWGGMNIIWMGDMLQLPPPSRFVRPLYYDCVLETKGCADFNSDSDRLDGIRVFREFTKMELSTQNRAKDPAHMNRIHRMRTSDTPIDDDIINSFIPLSAKDMQDEKWQFAPIVVTCNVERHLINKSQVIRFAKAKGLPVLTWVDPIKGAPCEVSTETDEKLDPAARRYFTLGAPAYIGVNMNSAVTGIVNGSPGWLHSLSWESGMQYSLQEALGPYHPGTCIEVPVPHTINVLRKGVDGKTLDVVPMGVSETTTEKEDAQVKRMRHPVELGFCVTFHKMQGQTVDRIILTLHPRNSCQLLSMSFESLYVAMSRVRRLEDMRIMHCCTAGLKHLRQLKRPACFDAWLAAYNKHGK